MYLCSIYYPTKLLKNFVILNFVYYSSLSASGTSISRSMPTKSRAHHWSIGADTKCISHETVLLSNWNEAGYNLKIYFLYSKYTLKMQLSYVYCCCICCICCIYNNKTHIQTLKIYHIQIKFKFSVLEHFPIS